MLLPRPLLALGVLMAVAITNVFAQKNNATEKSYDVVVYGGTPAGIMAAVAAGRGGKSVLLLEPSYLLGGMMAGGLTKTDVGSMDTVGGLSREFFKRVLDYYTKNFGADSEQVKQTHGGFFFEPKVAGEIFRSMLAEAKVDVRDHERLEKATMDGTRIASITVRNPKSNNVTTIAGKVFVDSTYEGDLLAAAGVPYRMGREASAEYNEPLAGMNEGPAMYRGKGDHRLQAFNIRGTLTNRDDLRVLIPKPENYDPAPYENLIATVKKYKLRTFEELFNDYTKWGYVNGKVDPNRADYVGANYNYIEGDPEERARVVKRIQDYWLSMWYMLQNDERLSEEFRESARKWGLPNDEYGESGHVTPQVYVREGRRMLGRYFLSQHDVDENRWKDDGICLGSYNFDSHAAQRFLDVEGQVEEGHFIQVTDDYEIPYRSLTPFAPTNLLVTCAVSASHVAYSTLRMEPVFMMIGHAVGLAARQAVDKNTSVQEISTDELRKELKDVGMPLAAMFRPTVEIEADADGKVSPGQAVKFSIKPVRLESPLKKIAWNFDGSGAVQSTEEAPVFTFDQPGTYTVNLIVEDQDKRVSRLAQKTIQVGDVMEKNWISADKPVFAGRWEKTRGSEPEYRERVAYTDRKEDKGTKSVLYTITIPQTGKYLVAQAYSQAPNRAKNVPVTITHTGGVEKVTVDQKKPKPAPYAFQPLGEYTFQKGEKVQVEISNAGTDGYVVADDVRFIWKGDK